jgi:hypothetical protein
MKYYLIDNSGTRVFYYHIKYGWMILSFDYGIPPNAKKFPSVNKGYQFIKSMMFDTKKYKCEVVTIEQLKVILAEEKLKCI